LAPAAIRAMTSEYRLKKDGLRDARTGRVLLSHQLVSDLGNLNYRVQFGTHAYLAELESVAAEIIASGKTFLACGGDHLVSLGLIRGLCHQIPSFQIVHVDAHRDLRTINAGEHPTHANFMAHALVHPSRAIARVLQVGVRGYDAGVNVATERVQIVNDEDLVVDLKRYLLPSVPVYLTIDTDAFDPVHAPAVNFPVFGGLRIDDLRKILSVIRDLDVPLVGCDWTEFNPRAGGSDITGLLVCHGLIEIACLLAKTRRFA